MPELAEMKKPVLFNCRFFSGLVLSQHAYGVRVGKFHCVFLTSKERDTETNLDYFGARYYASAQGRFTSVDPILSSGRTEDPQTWNRYVYVLNNPLMYIDQLGLYEFAVNTTDEEKKKFRAAFEELKKARDSYKEGSKERKRLDKIIAAYGEEGKGGPTIAFAEIGANEGVTNYSYSSAGEGKKVNHSITVTFDSNSDLGAGLVAHEGQHVSDIKDALDATIVRNNRYVTPAALNLTKFEREDRGYEIQQAVARGLGQNAFIQSGNRTYELFRTSWERIDETIPSLRTTMLFKRWEVLRNEYKLTPLLQRGERITQPRPPRR